MSRRIRLWLAAVWRRSRFESEMERELRSHAEHYARDLEARGLSREEALLRARQEFGAVQLIKDECRDARGLRWPDALVRDLRFALRMLWKSPTFTIVAALTLALCIGANTAVFSVVDAIVLRPLPYPHPERLFSVITEQRGHGAVYPQEEQSGRTWEAVGDGAKDFDVAVFSYRAGGVNLVVGSTPRYIKQQRVSAGFFRVLGVSPRMGREFTNSEDRVGGPDAAVLSDPLWRSVFHAKPDVIGAKVMLAGQPYTVIGVMPAGFRTNTPADLWTPLRPSTSGEGGGLNYRVMIRLHAGVSEARADAEIRAIGAGLFANEHFPPGVSAELRLTPLQRGLTSYVRKPVLLLWFAVGLVLLIGCVNIAGLLLARSAVRAREIGTRLALGGSKAAIARQLMTESLLLAILGSIAGTLLGAIALAGLKRLDIESLGISASAIALDAGVLAATAITAIVATFVFGLYPALQTVRVDIRSALAQSGARGASANASGWARRTMIVAEVALSVMLLVGAGLLIRTFAHLAALDPGFDGRNVVAATLSLRDARYRNPGAVNRLYNESLDRIRAMPGVEAAGAGLTLPYQLAINDWFTVQNGPHSQEHQITNWTYVTPGYFEALRMKLLRGRLFREGDNAKAQRVAIVNQAFVKKYLSGQSALETQLDAGKIVGVVGDVQEQAGWGDYGPLSPVPEIYSPVAQIKSDLSLIHTWVTPWWVVRSRDSRQAIVAGLQRAVAETDPLLPFAEFHSMDEIRSQALGFERLTATLLGILAALALVLSAVGIYGLIANSVVERTRELGIRMALGASAARAVRAVTVPGILLAGAGLVIGCALALLGTHAMRSLIFGVAPNDPVTFASVAAVLLLVAALASIVPAVRVSRIDPAQSLREE